MKKLTNTGLVAAPLLLISMQANAIEAVEVPEPSVLALLGVGLVVLGLVRRKK